MISAAYLAEQRRMHADHVYGHSGGKWAKDVLRIVRDHDAASILDYGCGTGAMADRLRGFSGGRFKVMEYDPAMPGKDALPPPADLVTCIDVLEHVEPAYLGNVLDHLKRLTRKVLFVVVSTRLAGKVLSDGRNAHLCVEKPEWWQGQLTASGRFTVASQWQHRPDEWCALLRPA